MRKSDGSHGPGEEAVAATSGPLRLQLSADLSRGRLQGAWWPRSRDLADELTSLVAGLPAELGPVTRAVYCPTDWDHAPRQVEVDGAPVELEPLPHHDNHLVVLSSASRDLTFLVVPPPTTPDLAQQAMSVASSPENQAPARDILRDLAAPEPREAQERWVDHGESWWAPNPVPPSHRVTPERPRPGRPRRSEAVAQAKEPVAFHEEDGVYIGHAPDGRTWRISEELTGWRLEFLDFGDLVATNAGVHRSVAAAIAEASR